MNPLAVGAGLWLGAIAATGSYFDLRQRRLPNWLCAVSFLSGLAYNLASAGWGSAQMALLHALVALIVGACLFALGGIGAGDAKYYAAFAAWFPIGRGIWLLTAVSLAGLVVLLGWMAWRTATRQRQVTRSRDDPFGKLPYGIAVSLGAVATFLLTRP